MSFGGHLKNDINPSLHVIYTWLPIDLFEIDWVNPGAKVKGWAEQTAS